MARKILANLHPCDDAHCSRRAKYVVVAPYVTRPFFVCGIHRRAYTMDICYLLRNP